MTVIIVVIAVAEQVVVTAFLIKLIACGYPNNYRTGVGILKL